MSQQELNVRFTFARDWFYDNNPDADIFKLDDITENVLDCREFEELSPEARKFIESIEYDAFKQGTVPTWFEDEGDIIPEDAPPTPQELEIMKGWV
jgi:hypothetical protein